MKTEEWLLAQFLLRDAKRIFNIDNLKYKNDAMDLLKSFQQMMVQAMTISLLLPAIFFLL